MFKKPCRGCHVGEGTCAEEKRGSTKKAGLVLAYLIPDLPYPFQRVTHTNGKDAGIVLLIAPFYNTNYFRVSGLVVSFHVRETREEKGK